MFTDIPLGLTPGQTVALQFVGAILLVVVTAIIMKVLERSRKEAAKQEFATLKAAAEAEAQKIIAKAQAEATHEIIRRREKFDSDTESVRQQLRDEEKRLAKREGLIDEKLGSLAAKEHALQAGEKALAEREKSLLEKQRQLQELIERQKAELLRVANLTMDQAKAQVIERVEKDMERETAQLISRRLETARDAAEQQAREIVVTAIQRYASEHTADSTVSAVGRDRRRHARGSGRLRL